MTLTDAVMPFDTSETIQLLIVDSGTRQLVEDFSRFLDLIGSEKVNLYGISYGTTVMSTFATLFPKRVNLLVLDGNV